MSKSLPPNTELPATATPAPDASSSSPSATPSLTEYNTIYHGTPTLQHAVTLAAAVLAPIGMLLPPRRMGPRNLFLAAGTFFATSQLTYDYTGQSIYQRFRGRMKKLAADQEQDLPPAALQRQAAMRAERERRRLLQEGAQAEASPAKAQEDGALHRLWMGNEKEDWIKERARKEKETLESGGGYWDLIMNQIGEVTTDLMGKGKKPEESTAPAPAEAPKSEDAKKKGTTNPK
ncbi:hypothetical protein SEUCBS139899_008209 [Sporothrix eucalyptigena]|uniref:Rhomboid family membrane protein n=1 Tax=Sporothrix eucalyptigena TaxID=1812306 RepID=A0ABP0BTY7_9PEZI